MKRLVNTRSVLFVKRERHTDSTHRSVWRVDVLRIVADRVSYVRIYLAFERNADQPIVDYYEGEHKKYCSRFVQKQEPEPLDKGKGKVGL